jgi:hypothetical protein
MEIMAGQQGHLGGAVLPKGMLGRGLPYGDQRQASLDGPLLACYHFSSLFLLCHPSCCQFPLRTAINGASHVVSLGDTCYLFQ